MGVRITIFVETDSCLGEQLRIVQIWHHSDQYVRQNIIPHITCNILFAISNEGDIEILDLKRIKGSYVLIIPVLLAQATVIIDLSLALLESSFY